jgi:hypothetical protein
MYQIKYSSLEAIGRRVEKLYAHNVAQVAKHGDAERFHARFDVIKRLQQRMNCRFFVNEYLARGWDLSSIERTIRSAGPDLGQALVDIGFIDAVLAAEGVSGHAGPFDDFGFQDDDGPVDVFDIYEPRRISVSVIRDELDECVAFSISITGKSGRVYKPVLGQFDMGLYLFPSMKPLLYPDEFSLRELHVRDSSIPAARERLRRALAEHDTIPF